MNPFVRACFVLAVCVSSFHARGAENDATPSATDSAAAAAAMNDLESQLRPGKRAFVEQQLELTPTEAKGFWPLYDDYQAKLSAFNERRLQNIVSYAEKYNADDMDDASATRLAEQALQLEKDEAANMERAFQKLRKVLPAVKAARYLQVESKIRALVRYQQAAEVPYVH